MLDVEQGENNKQQRGRPFAKGQSGNPRGRPPGVKRVVMSALLAPHAEGIAEALIEMANSGPISQVKLEAMRLCLLYLAGPPPNVPVTDDATRNLLPAMAADRLLEARKVLEGHSETPTQEAT